MDLQRNLTPPKLATFCAINKSFDWRITYHGGPRVELFGVLVNGCAIMLYGLAKKSYATKTCHILCNQQII
jgi:hypothetical protein